MAYKYPRTYSYATKKYSLKKDGNISLSAHFKLKEFQSKDGADEIVICPQLISVLESLFKKLNAKAINITSGYRTEKHSLAVGGKGKADNHHMGMAADIKVKKQDGTYFSSKEITLALEDMNYNGGIGLINKTNAVHVDTGSLYWFDETNKSARVPSWYSYWGVKKPANITATKEFLVKILDSNLNIRSGAGTGYKVVGQIKDKGIYTIVETKGTVGKANSWGKLKSGAGWISLNSIYAKKV